MKNLVRVSICAIAVSIFGGMAVNAQNITTVAGGGPPSGATPLVSKTSASVGAPGAVKQDALGNTYIMDNNLGRIFKVDTLGNITLFAGNGVPGFSGEGGLAVNASMFEPSGMCIDSLNNVYVADSDNGIIREIPVTTVGLKLANHIYTVAGVQVQSGFDFAGDGAAATSAHLHFPDGCSFDSHDNMYIADRGNNEIRVVIGTAAVAPVGLTPPVVAGFIYRFAGGNDGTRRPRRREGTVRTARPQSPPRFMGLLMSSSTLTTTSSSPTLATISRRRGPTRIPLPSITM